MIKELFRFWWEKPLELDWMAIRFYSYEDVIFFLISIIFSIIPGFHINFHTFSSADFASSTWQWWVDYIIHKMQQRLCLQISWNLWNHKRRNNAKICAKFGDQLHAWGANKHCTSIYLKSQIHIAHYNVMKNLTKTR